jgi:hypothetical protein
VGGGVSETATSNDASSLNVGKLGSQQELKRCTKCDTLKALELFSKNRRKPDGLDLHCRQCIRERIRSKKARQLAEGLCTSCGRPRGDSRSRWYCRKCLTRDSSTRRSREMRATAIRAYGGESPACVCCGETQPAFLTLDHVNNGGRAHRREKGNQGVYHELRKGGYPPGFQILCFNCNMARGWYSSCPHDIEGDPRPAHRCSPTPPRLAHGYARGANGDWQNPSSTRTRLAPAACNRGAESALGRRRLSGCEPRGALR